MNKMSTKLSTASQYWNFVTRDYLVQLYCKSTANSLRNEI